MILGDCISLMRLCSNKSGFGKVGFFGLCNSRAVVATLFLLSSKGLDLASIVMSHESFAALTMTVS